MTTWEKVQWGLLFLAVGSVIAGGYLVVTGWESARKWWDQR